MQRPSCGRSSRRRDRYAQTRRSRIQSIADADHHSLEHGRPTIGVFDSGVGGLTVLSALLRHIPDANYLYFGDTARLPYGSKSAATVAHYAVGAIRHLQSQGAERLVIACNTATALAFDEIKAASDVELIGVVEVGSAPQPRKPAATARLVVIGTDATVASHAPRRAARSSAASRQKKKPVRCLCPWSKRDGSSIRSPSK